MSLGRELKDLQTETDRLVLLERVEYWGTLAMMKDHELQQALAYIAELERKINGR